MSLKNGQVEASQFPKTVYLRTASHLRCTKRLKGGDPLERSFSVRCGQVSDSGQARQGSFDQLHTMRTIEQRFVDLVEVGATEIDQSSRFGAFGIVEEIETIFSSFVLQYKIHTLPLFVFFTLLVQVALHPDTT